MDEAFGHIEQSPRKTYVKHMQPPDGGWGYLVCLGVGLTFMLGFGASSAFGILFNDFFREQGGATGLTLVIGVYNGALSLAGFLSGIALKKYSYRQVGLVGAALFVIGDVLTIFVVKTYHLVLSFGLIRGAGFGTMIPVSFTAFNTYFTKKRTAMMSANQALSSLASITFPMLVTFLLAEYGLRWSLTIIMAIDLHLIFAMLVMHPVEWHLVKVPKKLRVSQNCAVTNVNAKGVVLDKSEDEVSKSNVNIIEIKDENKLNSKPMMQRSFIKIISENLEVDLLKDTRFLLTLLGIGFAFVSDVTYLALEPMLLFSYGFTKIEVATCVMIGALVDLFARFGLAVISYYVIVDAKKLFFIGTGFTIILRIALVSHSELWYVYSVTAISGMVRCTVQVLFPLVLSAAVPDRFTGALALHIIFSGILMLIADPLIGLIYEMTGSYVYCFMAMSVCCFICIVLWTVEYLVYEKKLFR